MVVGKYLDHLPLYRQSAILERETGLEISRATLDGWVMRVGELLQPITEAMAEELVSVAFAVVEQALGEC
jgi:transposase